MPAMVICSPIARTTLGKPTVAALEINFQVWILQDLSGKQRVTIQEVEHGVLRMTINKKAV